MSDELDINKIAAQFLQDRVDRAMDALSAKARDATGAIRSRFARTYKTYVRQLLERHARGKSFFVRSESIPLYDFFVPLDLSTQLRELKRPGAVELLMASPAALITGSGGSGKSMMMRHLLLTCLEDGTKIPIFVELRKLNHESFDLPGALASAMHVGGLDVDDAFLRSALSAGQFLVLLDGFDEVERASRKRLAAEVRQFADEHPANWIVMSSRPDIALEGWERFTQWEVEPLSLASAIELVEKVPFDDSLKEKFVADMQNHLFERHKSLLSNPLLLSIMLLTYSDVAHIPHKLSTFYGQAFESLFHRHDALKGGFQRERRSGLDIQDFGRAFAAFSLVSYDRREFSFSYARALELICEARDVSMLSFDAQSYLDDALQAVCLLLEDGMEIAFAHRSFQEYFVARFIQSAPPDIKTRLVQRFSPNVQSDSVIALLYEIDQFIVERDYILPHLEGLRAKIGLKRKLGITHYLRFLRLVYSDFHFAEDSHVYPSATIRDLRGCPYCS